MSILYGHYLIMLDTHSHMANESFIYDDTGVFLCGPCSSACGL